MTRNLIAGALVTILVAGLLLTTPPLQAQKKGQAISIQFGRVVAIEEVKTQSDAGKGALVGGTIGLITASGKSGKRRRRDAAIGATVGAGATRAKEGSLKALAYTVETPSGAVAIVSDQGQIRMGDCVSVEQSGSQGNIRRVSDDACLPGSEDVLAQLQAEFQEEAEQCLAAKDELVNAETDEQIDRAERKVHILCDD